MRHPAHLKDKETGQQTSSKMSLPFCLLLFFNSFLVVNCLSLTGEPFDAESRFNRWISRNLDLGWMDSIPEEGKMCPDRLLQPSSGEEMRPRCNTTVTIFNLYIWLVHTLTPFVHRFGLPLKRPANITTKAQSGASGQLWKRGDLRENRKVQYP